jgi:hypothetical protein
MGTPRHLLSAYRLFTSNFVSHWEEKSQAIRVEIKQHFQSLTALMLTLSRLHFTDRPPQVSNSVDHPFVLIELYFSCTPVKKNRSSEDLARSLQMGLVHAKHAWPSSIRFRGVAIRESSNCKLAQDRSDMILAEIYSLHLINVML